MAVDLDERLAARFPTISRQLIARVLGLPSDSPTRRRALEFAFRSHSGTRHPASGIYRTPEDRFEGLPDFPWEPSYRQVGDLRLAHVDVGEGAPVVMVHGVPAWSFAYRKLIPPIRDAGYRCVAPDNAGFGRSDKPTDPAWHTLERHVELTGSLIEDLDLREVTLVIHDFGGPVGLTVAQLHQDRIARIVILDTVFDLNEVWSNESWLRMRDWIFSTEGWHVAELIRASCLNQLSDEVVAGYEAPFPERESGAGVTGVEANIPPADDRGVIAVSEAWFRMLKRDQRPVLVLWGQQDVFLTLASGQRLTARIGREIDHVIPDAGHIVQEDQGELVGELIVDWLTTGQ